MSRMLFPVVCLATPAQAGPGLHPHPHRVGLARVTALLVGVPRGVVIARPWGCE